MSGFKNIEQKLHQFTRKFYTSELIKGGILFLSLGFLYLFFTLFLEHFFWLKPTARTILFWFFLLVELFLLIRFIAIPVFKLIGLRKGITDEESSKIIGAHFPEVKDKLLNVLQLKQNSNQSDLLVASIIQKTEELQPIPFTKAINFKKNTKYLKYAIVPVLIWLITLFTGTNGALTQSLERVVNHRTAYNPPAPFLFTLQNSNLNVIQGKPITVLVNVVGEVLPNEAKIYFDEQHYFLQNNNNGTFSYIFSDVQKPINFYVEANGVQSQDYKINVIATPTINNISLDILYPRYLGKRNETIKNSGDIVVPAGTRITWNVIANQTDSVAFINQEKRNSFKFISDDTFKFSKRIINSLNYQIATSNKSLQDFEKLQFYVSVIKDEAPLISVQSNIDSVSRGTAQFAGKVSDDYGITKLQIVYYNEENPQVQKTFDLQVSKQNIQTFFYQFPDGLDLEEGVNYELFFQVFDNDAVNGNKKSKSKVFTYRKNTADEIKQELLQEQRNTINNIQNTLQKQQKEQQNLEKVQKELQGKKKMNWNDKKKIQKFVKRQDEYNKMMQRQTEKLQEKLQENLQEKKEENETLQDKKEELKKRVEELKKTDKQKKLLDEIKKMAEKLNKEDLVKKAKELSQQNKQQQRSLERILELTKRFYVEQKTMQIADKINKLAKKQEELANDKDANLEKQKEIKKEFDAIKEELKELDKDNEKLKEPMELPDVEDEKEDIDSELNKSEENLSNENAADAKDNQKKSSKKMKQMSAKMQKAMDAAAGESMDEDMGDLREILDNLVTFSFKQETLMDKFNEISTTHPDFGKDLKQQNELKTYFEHIDDSLYVLSMRLPKISVKIKNDLATTHYNLEQSLENFSENRFPNGVSNQRYVMTAVNNLADFLSNVLNSMKNPTSMKIGKGKKGKMPGFSLPDLIQKQGELSEKMKKGMKKGKKPGEKPGDGKDGKKGEKGKGDKPGKDGKGKGEGEGGSGDGLDGELYEIYKQQSLLRQELQNQINNMQGGKGSHPEARKALKKMEDLENEILEKGFNEGTLQKMQNLNYELLKLDKAALEQGKDKKRKSKVNSNKFDKRTTQAIQFKKQFYNQTEILNRQSLPLQQNYKKKVREYFSEPKKE